MIGWLTQDKPEPVAADSVAPARPRFTIRLTRTATHRVSVDIYGAHNLDDARAEALRLAGGDCLFWDSVEWGDVVVATVVEESG